MKRVGIIGGGVAGLMSAWELARLGYAVELFEGSREFGGLAASVPFGPVRLERFYHFICRGDSTLIDTCRRLGLEGHLRWRAARTGHFHAGRIRDLSTPLGLLTFPHFTPLDKLRFALHVLRARGIKDWSALQERTAREWLLAGLGRRVYDVLWDPLLRIKFSGFHEELPAPWIWHRIYRVAQSRKSLLAPEYYGHLSGGSQTLIDALADAARREGARLHLNARAEALLVEQGRCRGVRVAGEAVACDIVVAALPLPLYRGLLPPEPAAYARELDAIPFLGVVCAILRLSRSISPYFWLNVNDPRISFNGVIEYSRLNAELRRDGGTIAYVPYYLDPASPRYGYSDEALRDEYMAALALVDPRLTADCLLDYAVFRAPYAQPVFRVRAGATIPAQTTPWENAFLIESTQLYPADRTISGTLRLAQDVVRLILARDGRESEASFRAREPGEIPA